MGGLRRAWYAIKKFFSTGKDGERQSPQKNSETNTEKSLQPKQIQNISVTPVVQQQIPLTPREEFIAALHIAKTEGFDIMIVYAQAWHETGGFEHVIGQYNFWGIKKPRAWVGKVHRLKTQEFIDNKMVDVYDDFIDFNTAEEAMKWWIKLIRTSRHYTKAYESRHDYKRFFNRITAWATDPKYAEKVKRVYRQLKPKRNQIKLAAANGGRVDPTA